MKNENVAVCSVLKATLSIHAKWGRISIGKGVATTLKNTPFLSIYLSQENDAIMIKACDEKEFLSIKIDESMLLRTHKEIRLHSQTFVNDLVKSQGWDCDGTYRMIGKYLERHNAIVFKLSEAISVSKQ